MLYVILVHDFKTMQILVVKKQIKIFTIISDIKIIIRNKE